MIRKMQTGRFIYRADDKPLKDRVIHAADIYSEVTGDYPNLACVNPKYLNVGEIITIEFEGHKIKIQADPRIQEKITYIGIGVVD